jgi:hypothetical protein
MTRLKLAELTSVVGVLVFEAKGGAKSPAWVAALYVACWLLPAALLGLLLFWIR